MGGLMTITAEQRAALLAPTSAEPAWLRRSLNGLTADFRPRIPQAVAPTAEQRERISARATRLSSNLAPAGVDVIGALVARLQAAFPSASLDAATAEANAESYLIALEGVPAFALDEACRRILQRKVPGLNAKFMPTAPELRALVDELSLPARWHLKELRRLLDAEVEREVSAEERARVAALLRGLNLSPLDEVKGAGAAA